MDLETLAKVVEQAIAQSAKTSSEPKLKSGVNSSKTRSVRAKTGTRKKLVVFRLSEEEFQQVQQDAGGMNLSNYLRSRLLKNGESKRVRSVIPLNNRLLYMRLHQLQTSINRYTKLVQFIATIPGCDDQDIVSEYLTLVETLTELIRVTRGELLGVISPELDVNADESNEQQ